EIRLYQRCRNHKMICIEMRFWNSRSFAGWSLFFAGILGVAWLARPARVPENVAYVSDEKGGITVIDLKTLDILKQIDLKGVEPRGISLTSDGRDRKSTRLNSSHGSISYAVFCLTKKR